MGRIAEARARTQAKVTGNGARRGPTDTAGFVRLDLAALMRKHGVTIRELAARTGITMKRIREIRAMVRVDYCLYCEMVQGVTGQDVFSRARYEAICRHRQWVAENAEREETR